MAKKTEIATTDQATMKRLIDSMRKIERMPVNPKRRARYPLSDFNQLGSTGGGDSGTDCGCCNPTNCLTLPDGFDSPFAPVSYKFTVPGALDCNCEDPPGGEITVRKVSEGIYESDSVQCYGPTSETVACTTTANWEWQEQEACPGDGTTTWICSDSGLGDYAWVKTAGCIDPCEDQELTQEELDLLGGPCATIEDAGLPLIETDCVPPGGLGNRWVLISVDDESCVCMPIEPDYDGTELGQLAQTDCTGTKSASGEDELQDSFWRLTVGELGAYCQNTTKLDFVVGETVVLTYALSRPCKPFCPLCENKFELNQCGPFTCESIPVVVCVAPSSGYIPNDYWSVLCLCDPVVALPEVYLVTLPDPTENTNDCFAYNTGADFYCFVCDQIAGKYAVYFDQDYTDANDSAGTWISDIIPFTNVTSPSSYGFKVMFAAYCPSESGPPFAWWIYIAIVNSSGTVLSGWQPQFKYVGELPKQDCTGTITMPGVVGAPDVQGCYFESSLEATAEPFLFN